MRNTTHAVRFLPTTTQRAGEVGGVGREAGQSTHLACEPHARTVVGAGAPRSALPAMLMRDDGALELGGRVVLRGPTAGTAPWVQREAASHAGPSPHCREGREAHPPGTDHSMMRTKWQRQQWRVRVAFLTHHRHLRSDYTAFCASTSDTYLGVGAHVFGTRCHLVQRSQRWDQFGGVRASRQPPTGLLLGQGTPSRPAPPSASLPPCPAPLTPGSPRRLAQTQTVRMYDADTNVMRAQYHLVGPALDCSFEHSQERIFSGGLDRRVIMHDLATGSEFVLGSHDDAVRCVEHSETLSACRRRGLPAVDSS